MAEPTTCIGCKLPPEAIEEYVEMGKLEGMTPAEFVKGDGSFNPDTGAFCCTDCYVDLGCPSRMAPAKWRAGDPLGEPS